MTFAFHRSPNGFSADLVRTLAKIGQLEGGGRPGRQDENLTTWLLFDTGFCRGGIWGIAGEAHGCRITWHVTSNAFQESLIEWALLASQQNGELVGNCRGIAGNRR